MTYQYILNSIRKLTNEGISKSEIVATLSQYNGTHLIRGDTSSLDRLYNTFAIKERYKICREIFDSITFPYAVIKGALLSYTAYGDPFARKSGDIDLLIRRCDADAMKDLLIAHEFVQGRITDHGIVPFSRREILFQTSMSHQTAPYVKETGNRLCPYVNVDINMDVMWGECNQKSDMDYVLSKTEDFGLLGAKFRRLSPEMEFISLCLHHYKDMNSLYLLSHGSFTLGLFCDIYFYLKHAAPNALVIKDICQELNVGQYVYVCLYDTDRIFEDKITKYYLDMLESQKAPELIDSFGLNESERQKWPISLFERLFTVKLPEYLNTIISEEKKAKINLNQELM